MTLANCPSFPLDLVISYHICLKQNDTSEVKMSDYFHKATTHIPMLATWIWTRGRRVLVVLMLAALIILLAHMTPPVVIYAQHIHLAPSDQGYRPGS